jgi:ankyrin repeat protein
MPCDCYDHYDSSDDSDDEFLEIPTATSGLKKLFDLLSLPNELVLEVARQLPDNDLSALMWTNKHMCTLLAPLRYRDRYMDLVIAVKKRQPMAITLLMDRMQVDLHAIPVSILDPNTDGNLLTVAIAACPYKAMKGDSQSLMKTLKLLIANGVNIDQTDDMGFAPIHHAVNCNRMKDVVALLLDKGANGGVRDCVGRTPMHYAAKWNHGRILGELISRGLDVEEWDCQGDAPIHLAMESVIDSTFVCGSSEATAVELTKRMKSLRLLAETGAVDVPTRDDGATPLHRVIDPKGMHHYCRGSHIIARSMAKILLENGADPNARDYDGKSVIHIAVEKPNIGLLEALIALTNPSEPIDLNSCVRNKIGDSPLHHAIRNNPCGCHDDDLSFCLRGFVVDSLIGLGVKVDLQNRNLETPLHLVAGKEYSCSHAVEMLILAGARVDIPDALGESPVHIAAEMRREDTIRLLLKNGKGKELLEMRDSKGRTPAECVKGKGKKKVDGILHRWYQKWANEEAATTSR